MHLSAPRPAGFLVIALALLLAACAFDVVILQKTPAELAASADSGERWTLGTDTRATLAAGWASALRAGTTWRRLGTIAEGDVFRTKDQLVTVEASNLYQADIVVSGGQLVGFYLPVDHLFTRCGAAVAINLAKTTG
jgi:hypothetical protein